MSISYAGIVMARRFNKNAAEDIVFAWMKNLGYMIRHSLELAWDRSPAEQQDCSWLCKPLLPKFISGDFQADVAQRFITDALT